MSPCSPQVAGLRLQLEYPRGFISAQVWSPPILRPDTRSCGCDRAAHRLLADTEFLANLRESQPAFVQPRSFGYFIVRKPTNSHLDALLGEVPSNRVTVNTVLPAEFHHTGSGLVFGNELVSFRWLQKNWSHPKCGRNSASEVENRLLWRPRVLLKNTV